MPNRRSTGNDVDESISPRFPLIGLMASVAGLVTVAAWSTGGTTPLATAGRLTGWLGWDISGAVAVTAAWANASHRGDAIGGACLVVVVIMLGKHLPRLAHEHRDRPFEREAGTLREYLTWRYASDARFWAIAWVTTALLAEFHGLLVEQALVIFIMIFALRAGARAVDVLWNDQRRERGELGWGAVVENAGYYAVVDFGTVVEALFLLPTWSLGRLAEPHPSTYEADKRASEQSEGSSAGTNTGGAA